MLGGSCAWDSAASNTLATKVFSLSPLNVGSRKCGAVMLSPATFGSKATRTFNWSIGTMKSKSWPQSSYWSNNRALYHPKKKRHQYQTIKNNQSWLLAKAPDCPQISVQPNSALGRSGKFGPTRWWVVHAPGAFCMAWVEPSWQRGPPLTRPNVFFRNWSKTSQKNDNRQKYETWQRLREHTLEQESKSNFKNRDLQSPSGTLYFL